MQTPAPILLISINYNANTHRHTSVYTHKLIQQQQQQQQQPKHMHQKNEFSSCRTIIVSQNHKMEIHIFEKIPESGWIFPRPVLWAVQAVPIHAVPAHVVPVQAVPIHAVYLSMLYLSPDNLFLFLVHSPTPLRSLLHLKLTKPISMKMKNRIYVGVYPWAMCPDPAHARKTPYCWYPVGPEQGPWPCTTAWAANPDSFTL